MLLTTERKGKLDMLKQYKFKTELHAHTKPASKCSEIPPEYMVEAYKNLGFTTVVLTNHFVYTEDMSEEKVERIIADYEKTKELGDKNGLNIVLGAEIRFSESFNDYLVYGIDTDELYKINKLLGIGIAEFYRQYKNDRNVIVQAHPFRDGMTQIGLEFLDGYEVFNMHPGHNSRVGFAAKAVYGNGKIITGGTDFHHVGHEGMCAMVTKVPVTDSYQLAGILKSGDYIFDIWGNKTVPANNKNFCL